MTAPVAESRSTPGVGARTFRAVAWAYGSYIGGRVLVLVSTAILARLLTPRDFGLVAAALIVITLLETLRDFGVTQALIVQPKREALALAHTAWTFSVALGLFLTLLATAFAPAVAALFDEPQIKGLLPILGGIFLLRSIASTHYALAQRELDFRTRTVAELADQATRGISSVALAFAGLGVYSLAIGYLLGTVALTIVLWRRIPWRPVPRLRRDHLRKLISFGGKLTAVDVVAALIGVLDYVFVGSVLGVVALGLYTLAYRVPELLISNLAAVAGHVLFPAFASVEREAMGHAFAIAVRSYLLVALPLGIVVGLLAEPLVLVLFGDRWLDAVPAMRVIALYTVVGAVTFPAGSVYKAIGRPGLLLRLTVPRAILLGVSLIVFVDEGIVAAALCQLGGSVLLMLVNVPLAARILHVSARTLWRGAWPTLTAGAAMAAAVGPIALVVDSPLIALALGVGVGLPVYAALLWLVGRDTVEHALRVAGLRPPPPVVGEPLAKEPL